MIPLHAPETGQPIGRRASDAVPTLLAGSTISGSQPATLSGTGAGNAALLLDFGTGEVLLVPAAEAHILARGAGGEELQGRAAALAQALQRDRERLVRRLRMPDLLLAYSDGLLSAHTDDDIYVALRDAAGAMVSACTAVVFVAAGEAPDAAFQPLSDPVFPVTLGAIPARTATWFVRPAVITRAEVEADDRGLLTPLAGVMEATGAAQLLCAPVGGDALLVLVERRRDGLLTGEELDLFNSIVRHAECALRNLAIERELAARALHDLPEAAGDRLADLVVDCALALSRSGQATTLLVAGGEALADARHTTPGERYVHALLTELRQQLGRMNPAPAEAGEPMLVLAVNASDADRGEVLERLRGQVGGTLRSTSGVVVFNGLTGPAGEPAPPVVHVSPSP